MIDVYVDCVDPPPTPLIHHPTSTPSQLWDLETRVCTATFQGHREAVTAVDFRPSG